METSKCPRCGSPRNIHVGFEGARFYCGSAAKAGEEGLCWEGEECQRRQEVNGLRAEVDRLKFEKEAAERERDGNEQIINQLCDIFDCDGDEVTSKVKLMAERFDEETAQLTAATSRAEALATGIESIHSGRIVLSQADNGEWGAVLGTRIVTGCETAAEAVLAALLPPAKEVEGG